MRTLIFLSILFLIPACGRISLSFEKFEPKANLVSESLEKFYNTHNSYPKTLNELVPNYLNEIPSNIDNFKVNWVYKVTDKEIYLFVPIKMDVEYVYDFKVKQWKTDTH